MGLLLIVFYSYFNTSIVVSIHPSGAKIDFGHRYMAELRRALQVGVHCIRVPGIQRPE